MNIRDIVRILDTGIPRSLYVSGGIPCSDKDFSTNSLPGPDIIRYESDPAMTGSVIGSALVAMRVFSSYGLEYKGCYGLGTEGV